VSVVRVITRCRVDLAGGTLDIWPLGLLHPGSRTVNVAVDLPVRVELAPRAGDYELLQGGERWTADAPAGFAADPGTALAGLVLETLDLPPCRLVIDSASPRGAGLGASSALTVALLAAGELALSGRLTLSAAERAALARDLEARLMGLPTGQQDHFPAQLGGALELEHRPGGERVRRLAVDLDALGARLLVAYTGRSHFSAGNNWQVIRRRLEADADVIARLDAVRDAARDLPAALEAADWARVGALMSAEWHARRGLAPEVSTPALEALLEAAAEAGAWGGKVCGAGGGGCLAVLCPPERRAAVEAGLRGLGARLLAAPPTARGLEAGSEER
jgi:D-glycero-alpha-D-manno-heptose-7-phosphate kinase